MKKLYLNFNRWVRKNQRWNRVTDDMVIH